jgi:tetratricopeptide (TPR) repeat protein
MKKSLITLLLVLVVAASALAQQAPAQPAGQPPAQQQAAPGQQPAPGQPAAPAQQKKEIKDPAEYNAYMAAVNTQDPNQKASALESFLQTYPNSVIKEDAMELLMKTYQQANNIPKMQETGQRLLQVNPNNLTALALMAYMDRMRAMSGDKNSTELLNEAGQFGERGLQQLQTAPKPEGYSDADWAKMKDSFKSIFSSAVGTNALNQKNYQQAAPMLLEAVKANPNDYVTVYQLAVADLEQKPPVVDGLFWGARSVVLAQQQNPQAAASFQKYIHAKYVRYHGGEDGFDALMKDAATQATIPPGFTVAPAPSPAEQAAQMLQGKTPDKMGFGEWEFILTSGNEQAADTVWNAIKGKALQMQGKVISASPTVLNIAATEDAINANQPEIELTMVAAIPAKLQPKPGATIIFEGTPTSYTAQPFLVKMDEGKLATKGGGAEAPAKKAPVHKKPVHH